jgi:hypothetical protein
VARSGLLGEAESARAFVKDRFFSRLNAEGLGKGTSGDEGDYDVVRVNFMPTDVENAHTPALWEQFSFGDVI